MCCLPLVRAARNEHALLTWTCGSCISGRLLDLSVLSPDAAWSQGDAVQLVPSELSNED